MKPVDLVLGRLERHKPAGNGQWKACCPAHDDRNPSLSISEGENGAVLLHCFAGCEAAAVVQAMGLTMGDLYPPKDAASGGRSRAQRNYTRPTGAPAMRLAPGEQRERPPAETSPTRPRLFTLTRADHIERKPTDWLIRGYLVRDTLAGLIAPPGACKSFLAVDWACRVATGTDWYGREVKPGAVFYLAGEGQRGLRKRMDGWEIANGVSLQGAPLFVASSLPFLCDEGNAQETLEIIEEMADTIFFDKGTEPALIVVDTVARAMNGANENSAEDMGRFVASLDLLRRQWGATVLTVHHTGHQAADRGRGSSNYGASLDSDFYLTAKGDQVLLTSGPKAKDWRPPPPVTLTRVEVEVEVPGEDGEPVRETTLTLHDAPGQMMDTAQRDKAVELGRQGMSQRQIAEAIGASKSSVQRWLKEAV